MNALSVFHLAALVGVLSLAVYTDLRERRIPNRVTVPGLLLALALAPFVEGGFPVGALAGAGVALAVTFPLVALGGIGAGDAKLLTAVGAFVGPGGLLSVLVYGGLAGGVLAFANAIRRGALLGVLVNMKNLLLHWITFGRRGQKISLDSPGAQSIPYALPIAAAALMTWFFPISLGGSP
jgi:prepilin peptidase CpaA